MNDDTKVLETAKTMIERYGKDAIAEAELRASELLEHNEMRAYAFWIEVKGMVSELLKIG